MNGKGFGISAIAVGVAGLCIAGPTAAHAGGQHNALTGGSHHGAVRHDSKVPGPAGPPVGSTSGHATNGLRATMGLGTVSCGPNADDAAIAQRISGSFHGTRMGSNIDAEQVACGRQIVAATKAAGLDQRAAYIALLTSMTETTLHNYTGGDRDSIGLFQQRPSQGWGTPAQVQDPTYATQKFLATMQHFFPNNSWESGDPGNIAQQVQRSGVADAYDHELSPANALIAQLWTGGGTPTPPPPPPPPSGGKYYERVWKQAPSYRDTSLASPAGHLNSGKNYFYCQAQGAEVNAEGYQNNWWLKTDDDSGNRNVWVNAIYLASGSNDGQIPGVPVCAGSAPAPTGKVYEKVWVDAASYNSATGGQRVGTLHRGRNYFYCQQQGDEHSLYGYRNNWWLKTDDDSGNRNVWVNATTVSGGVNDGQIPGVPTC